MAADEKISGLPAATVPLVGDELFEIVQGGVNKKVAKSDVSTGGSFTAASVAEVNTGTENAKGVTPLSLQGSKYETQYGLRTFVNGTTGTNTYTGNLSPAITTYGSGGLKISVKFTNANTSSVCTLALNGLSALNLVKANGSALVPGDIPAGSTKMIIYDGTNLIVLNPSISEFTDFQVLTDAAPTVFNCNSVKEPKGYWETAVNRTLDLQNVRGENVLNLYSAIVLIIKKTTASDIVLTLDSGYTNKDLLTDATVSSYTLSGAINTYHKITALVLGQASSAIIWWNYAIPATLSIPLTTGSIFVGVGGVATAKALSGEFDASTGTVSLAALGIAGSKIAAGAITYAKMLGTTGGGELIVSNDNSGGMSAPYPLINGTITNSTVIAALVLETSWAGDTKSVANTLEGQSYKGTGSTGITYYYYCTVDGTVIRIVTGEAVPIDQIQIPPCTEITGTSTSMAKNNSYVANNASRVALLLPATAAIGDIVEVTGKGAGGWRITQNASQIIRGAANSTSGTGGYIESNAAQYSGVRLKCITANTDWVIQSVQGAITTV